MHVTEQKAEAIRACIAAHKEEMLEDLMTLARAESPSGDKEHCDACAEVLAGLVKACEKRAVSLTVLEKITTDIEQQILNTLNREVRSERIGELVMEHLKEVDEVAYVRFASVYRQFRDINSFMEELSKLLETRNS